MANVRELVKGFVEEFVAQNPHQPGMGRRKIFMPEPRPEDERPPYKADGEVPEGYTRAEIIKPNVDQNDPASRKGAFWTHVMHQGKTSHVLERVFSGDIVDIPDAEFEVLIKRNWVREPWKPKAPGATKQQAA